MIPDGALVVYKNKPAIATRDGDRIKLSMADGDAVRVRDKDIFLLHPGPLKSVPAPTAGGDFETAWEMTTGEKVELSELAELVFGRDGPAERLACWNLALDGLPFRLEENRIVALNAEDRGKEESKRKRKENDVTERAGFLARAKKFSLLPGDERWLGEIEALALGRTQKSRNAHDVGAGETPESAHAWLLRSGAWTPRINPYPARSGHPVRAPELELGPDDDDDRLDLSAMQAWAIDNAWSRDPDDAISWDGSAVWVHVADPASAIPPGSEADLEAANRSGTLYLPEGSIPMLPDQALDRFGLGLADRSRALSFRMEVGPDGLIGEVSVRPSWVTVMRRSYEAAEPELESGPLAELTRIAGIRAAYRAGNGAVDIDIPETRVWVEEGVPRVEPVGHFRSSAVVREMMVLAGEAAARWAFARGLPFPYYSQEAPGSREGLPPGLAGEFAKRRLMRAGMAGVQPRAHQGLGVTMYAQATSPLRRYGDLLGHQQIRAALAVDRGVPGAAPLPADELSLRLAMAAAGAAAVRKAERSSETHWTLAWLMEHPDWAGEGVVAQAGLEALVYLPAIGLETRIRGGELELNTTLRMRFLEADLARLDAAFAMEDKVSPAT